MRNLKRALSLALAVVMVVGLMIVGAGAVSVNDFGDKAEITPTHVEAVALMTDLEILNGGLDGNFSPKGALNREALAKITFLVATRQTNWDLYKGTSCDLTDIAGSWAEGAIKYCYSVGYISGNPDKTYSPNGTLTTVAVAKTLLCALGFDAKDRGYVNDNAWSLNIMRDAEDQGLLKNLTNTEANAIITREDACLMAYNAMFANVRTPIYGRMPTLNGDMVTYVTGYTVEKFTLGLKNHGVVKVTGTVTANNNAAVLDTTEANLTVSPAVDSATKTNLATAIGTSFNSKLSLDQVGSTVTVYMKGSSYTVNPNNGEVQMSAAAISAVSTSPAVGAGNTLATSTNGTTIAQLTTKPTQQAPNPKFKAEVAATATYILNGAVKDYANADKTEVDTAVAKKGVVVEFIDVNSDNKAEVVKVTEKKVATLTADPVLSEEGKKVAIAGISELAAATDVKKVVGYEGLKKGDVVLYVTVGGVTTIEKAQKITGTITAASSDKTEYTIGGTKYAFSDLANAASAAAKTNFKDEQWFALDNGGNIVAFNKTGEEAPTPETKYAVALAFGKKTEGSEDDLTAASKTVYQVKLLFTDGTSDVVTLDALMVPNAQDATKFDKFDLSTSYDKLGDHTNKLVSYTEKDGKYTVTEVGNKVTTLANVTGGKPVFTTDNTDQLIGTKNTTFLMMVGAAGKEKPQVVTGIANLSNITASNITTIEYIADEDGFVTLAYLAFTKFDEQTSTDWVYFLKNEGADETATGYSVPVIKDDKVDTAVINAANYTGITTGDDAVVSGFAEVTYDKDGKITAATAITDANLTDKTGMVKKTGVAMQGSYVKSGSDVYEVADDAVIIKINDGKAETVALSGLKAALTAGQGVASFNAYVVVPQGTMTIEVMYIVPVAAQGGNG